MEKNFETVYAVALERSAKAGVLIKNPPLLNESVVSALPFQELARQGLVALFDQMKGVDVSPADVGGFFFASAISQKLFGNGNAYYALPQMLLRNAFPDLAKKGQLRAVGRTVEKACSSGGSALQSAWEMVHSGDAECVVVLGAEKMCGVSNDFILGGLTDGETNLLMANLAEIEAKVLQQKFGKGFGAKEHDDWGVRSFALAKQHNREHVVVPLYGPDGSILLDHDNAFEANCDRIERILSNDKARRRMCFPGCEIMTVLNASQYASGWSGVILASESFVRERNLTPLTRIITCEEWSERKPEEFIIAPYGAMQKSLRVSGLSVDDLQHIELNEAFAEAALFFKEMGVPEEIINPWGGAIADGHPIGATFIGLLKKQYDAMKQNGQRIGGVFVCNAACEATGTLSEVL